MALYMLKTDPQPFRDIRDGRKRCEIRKDDREFPYKVDDVLCLQETMHTGSEMAAGHPLAYTGERLYRRVLHVQTGYGLQAGHVALSLGDKDETPEYRRDAR